jgi:putative solute:sodium symporter small subunit
MNENDNGYHISLFKPTTDRARFNRDLVVWLASIWFVAIFGFQIALRVLEKPTPEPSYIAFENVWDNVKAGTASKDEIQRFGQATLSVLGKVMIDPSERILLSQAMSWSIYSMFPDSLQAGLVTRLTEFEAQKTALEDIGDPAYISTKNKMAKRLSPMLGLNEFDARTRILPIELTAVNISGLSDDAINSLPGIMKKYTVHNQSFLTDFIFLGFPFHYFYTAFFLLVLFVGLCWIYCVRTDRRDKILGIED